MSKINAESVKENYYLLVVVDKLTEDNEGQTTLNRYCVNLISPQFKVAHDTLKHDVYNLGS